MYIEFHLLQFTFQDLQIAGPHSLSRFYLFSFYPDFIFAFSGKERVAGAYSFGPRTGTWRELLNIWLQCQLCGSTLTDTPTKFLSLQSQTFFTLGWNLPHYNCHLIIFILPCMITGKLVLYLSGQGQQMLEAAACGPYLFSIINPWFLPLLLVKYSGFFYYLFQVWVDQLLNHLLTLPQSSP